MPVTSFRAGPAAEALEGIWAPARAALGEGALGSRPQGAFPHPGGHPIAGMILLSSVGETKS